MDTTRVCESFWRTKLLRAAVAEVLTISIAYLLSVIITRDKMFAMGIAAGFSIMSIYIWGPIIGWFQVVVVRAASFVSIIEGILHGCLGETHLLVRVLALAMSVFIPVFLTAYLWSKKRNSADSKNSKDDFYEKKQISQAKAVILIISVIAILNSLFYLV